jgi:phosphate:Na+ symporter
MVVGFVNAGLLSLAQAIGVIMGANIGTTVTGWIIAILGFKVNVTAFALPAIGIGLPLLFIKRLKRGEWGETFIGFGLLFLGLKFLKDSVPDIRENPEVLEFLRTYTGMGILSHVIFICCGTILTIIIQSSSAAMAITLTIAYLGWIDFPTAAAIVLGENIGTTITAYLASFGTRANARRAARVHMIFNVVGVIWISFIFNPFIRLIDLVVPGDISGREGITTHLAMFHTMFNVANTLLFIGFIPQLASLAERLVKATDKEEKQYRLKYISTGLQDTPEINILNAKKELTSMCTITEQMFGIFLDVFNHPKKKMKKQVEELKEMEDFVDQMQEELTRYLAQCAKENLNDQSAQNVSAMIRIINELENISDSCYNLILLSQRRYDKKILFSSKALKQIGPYTLIVKDFLAFNNKHLNGSVSNDDLKKAFKLERKINRYRNNLKKAAQRRLQKGSDVSAEILYIDTLSQIERIGDYSLRISRALRLMG